MTVLIHYRFRTLIVLSPALVLYELATLFITLVHGWGKLWARAYLSLLSNRRMIWQRRQLMQQNRCVNDKDLLVGGPLPLAPGFIRSPAANMTVATLSMILNLYWRLTRRWFG